MNGSLYVYDVSDYNDIFYSSTNTSTVNLLNNTECAFIVVLSHQKESNIICAIKTSMCGS